MTRSLQGIRHVALDLDGTIYSGGTLFETALPFLSLLGELGLGYTFLTNNSSKSLAEYREHFARLGLPLEAPVYSSTQSTIEHLRARRPEARRLFLLGTPAMRLEFADAGFAGTEDDPSDEPDAVVVGFDTGLVFSRLCRAAYWIQAGKPFIATHPDRICPTDEPTVLVDCGSICAALEKATGRAPEAVPGKPDPAMIRGLLRRHRLEAGELAMVGDRLYTDMEMARRAGVLGILVLTGETRAEEAANCHPAPDLAVTDLAELGALLRANRSSAA